MLALERGEAEHSLAVLLVPLNQLIEPVPHGVAAKTVLGDGEGEHFAAAAEGDVVDVGEALKDFVWLDAEGEITAMLRSETRPGQGTGRGSYLVPPSTMVQS